MVPPIASPSMLGVKLLPTSNLSNNSDGNKSKGINRFLLSGLGILIPFTSVLIYLFSMPLIIGYLASPEPLFSIVTPLTLCKALATVISGNN